jgi:hypothetical protein
MAVFDKNSQRELAVKECSVAFTDGKQQLPVFAVSNSAINPFPVSLFQYKQWRLKNLGIGIYEEVATGSNTYDN